MFPCISYGPVLSIWCSATESLLIPAMILQQEFFLPVHVWHLCVCDRIGASLPPSISLCSQVWRLFSGSYFPYATLLLFVIILYSGGQFAYIFFLLYCQSAPLSAQASRHRPASRDQLASLLCRGLPGQDDDLTIWLHIYARGRARPLLGWNRTARAGRCQHWQSGYTERFLSDVLCRTPLTSSGPEHWKGRTVSCFLWNTVTWVPAAKHAYLGMVCCSPAQSQWWHASTAKNNINSLFLLLGYICTAGTHSWVQDGTSSNPSQALLVPFQTVGWAKCLLVCGFT